MTSTGSAEAGAGDARTHTLELEVGGAGAQRPGAARNRGWLAERGVLALNLMSSPGAGKTTLLERTMRELGRARDRRHRGRPGDRADAERIRATGGRAVQVNTGAGCHLDAGDGRAARSRRCDPPRGSLVLIENVGNLVCPALFDLGERRKVVVISVTEGEDKPLKYPHMFRAADLVVLNKIDLLPLRRLRRGAAVQRRAR